MAKAKPITGLDPHAPTGQNARSIARTRLDEMYEWARYVDQPYNIKELHNLRIAAKRLRYTLQIFEDALPDACRPIAEELSKLQDELGALHDSDVMIALLRLCLGSEDAGPPYEQLLSKVDKQPQKGRVLLRPELVADVVDPNTSPSAEERYGLEQLLLRRHQKRDKQYQKFRQHWDQLEARDFYHEILDILNDSESKERSNQHGTMSSMRQ
jgi:hypothetical protein